MAFPAILLSCADSPSSAIGWFQRSGWHLAAQEPPPGFAGGHAYFEKSHDSVLGLYGFVLDGERGGSAVVFWAVPKRLRGSLATQELAALAQVFPNSTATRYPGFRQTQGVLKFFMP